MFSLESHSCGYSAICVRATEVILTVENNKKLLRHPTIYFVLTLKVSITTAADDLHKYFFIVSQRKKKT